MVVNTPAGDRKIDEEKQTPKGEVYGNLVPQKTGKVYAAVRRAKRGNCCLVTSLVFNFLLIAGVVTACVFLHRLKSMACEMKVEVGKYNMELYGIDYEVEKCTVRAKYDDFDAYNIPKGLEPVKEAGAVDLCEKDRHKHQEHQDPEEVRSRPDDTTCRPYHLGRPHWADLTGWDWDGESDSTDYPPGST